MKTKVKKPRVRLTTREILHYVSRLEKLFGYTTLTQVAFLIHKEFEEHVSVWLVRKALRRALKDGALIRDPSSYRLRINPDYRGDNKVKPDLSDLRRLVNQ
jgi:hypothetical protein